MIVPFKRETIISSLNTTEIKALLEISLKNDFNGTVSDEGFRLSKKVSYPNNYIPLVCGSLEPSSRGCIIIIRYTLFFSTKLFLVFWTSLCLLIGLFLLFELSELNYSLIAFGGALVNYLVTSANFNKQFKLTRKLLFTSLEITTER